MAGTVSAIEFTGNGQPERTAGEPLHVVDFDFFAMK
jgi:hypothetical protein